MLFSLPSSAGQLADHLIALLQVRWIAVLRSSVGCWGTDMFWGRGDFVDCASLRDEGVCKIVINSTLKL